MKELIHTLKKYRYVISFNGYSVFSRVGHRILWDIVVFHDRFMKAKVASSLNSIAPVLWSAGAHSIRISLDVNTVNLAFGATWAIALGLALGV